jgi:uncharacterized membrane protein
MPNESTGKSILTSKTLWTNVLAIAALVAQNALGIELTAETQVSILAAVNVALRLVTKEPVVWS